MFGLETKPGLAESLAQGFPALPSCLQLTPENLWLLPAGSKPDQSPLNLDALKLRVDELRSKFDYIVIEAPDLSESGEAVLWGKVSDGVVIVVDSSSTRKDVALGAKYDFEDAGVHLLGAVFSGR
jgi:Mrp family chromosome partitioning ATPase